MLDRRIAGGVCQGRGNACASVNAKHRKKQEEQCMPEGPQQEPVYSKAVLGQCKGNMLSMVASWYAGSHHEQNHGSGVKRKREDVDIHDPGKYNPS